MKKFFQKRTTQEVTFIVSSIVIYLVGIMPAMKHITANMQPISYTKVLIETGIATAFLATISMIWLIILKVLRIADKQGLPSNFKQFIGRLSLAALAFMSCYMIGEIALWFIQNKL